jgi:hypothetical protein
VDKDKWNYSYTSYMTDFGLGGHTAAGSTSTYHVDHLEWNDSNNNSSITAEAGTQAQHTGQAPNVCRR